MPWQEQSLMALRLEFVTLARQEGANIAELCRRFGISRQTGDKWLTRFQREGVAGLDDQSRQPITQPGRTPDAVAAAIVAARTAHPSWGGRKLHHLLIQQGQDAVPAPSTITAILRRHERLNPEHTGPRAWQRFERAAPNDRWQVDFMGHRPLEDGQRVHPLTILDDHSRLALGLRACADEQQAVVQAQLIVCFQRYGLPRAILTDNGPPWGAGGGGELTALEAWLLRLGIEPWHGRIYHPQTQGKVERLHGTIAAEVFAQRSLPDLATCQAAFDAFRQTSNLVRPHAALAFAVPASRDTPSPRPFPKTLPEITYGPDDQVRRVQRQGAISFHGQLWFVGHGLVGLPVAVRPTTTDGSFRVVYCHREVATIDLTTTSKV